MNKNNENNPKTKRIVDIEGVLYEEYKIAEGMTRLIPYEPEEQVVEPIEEKKIGKICIKSDADKDGKSANKEVFSLVKDSKFSYARNKEQTIYTVSHLIVPNSKMPEKYKENGVYDVNVSEKEEVQDLRKMSKREFPTEVFSNKKEAENYLDRCINSTKYNTVIPREFNLTNSRNV